MPGIKSHIYYFFRLRGMLYHGRKKERGRPGENKRGQNVPFKTADKIAEGRWKIKGVKMTPLKPQTK